MPKNGELVPESSNPLKVSQARPIKYFWVDLAQRVYLDNGCQAKIVVRIIVRIKLRHKKFEKYLQNLMSGVKTKFYVSLFYI